MAVRKASHSGSWYDYKKLELEEKMNNWLDTVKLPIAADGISKAIISPHAGYSYSGATAAYGFSLLRKRKYKRIFVLGPSHKTYIEGCALSKFDSFETPIGILNADKDVTNSLISSGKFKMLSGKQDEDEHSIEMQLPFLAKVLDSETTIVPIVVGDTNSKSERLYAQILQTYFEDDENFFVISSDFCHWGKRFNYTYYDQSYGEIHESIRNLDYKGFDSISEMNPSRFYNYLKTYNNTICGRHPIGILLNMIELCKSKYNFRFDMLNYSQSNYCSSFNDSSPFFSFLHCSSFYPYDRVNVLMALIRRKALSNIIDKLLDEQIKFIQIMDNEGNTIANSKSTEIVNNKLIMVITDNIWKSMTKTKNDHYENNINNKYGNFNNLNQMIISCENGTLIYQKIGMFLICILGKKEANIFILKHKVYALNSNIKG